MRQNGPTSDYNIADKTELRLQHPMRRLALLVSIVFSVGCAHARSPEEQLMRNIEARVHLPERASPVNRYRRHYALAKDDPNVVEAVYERGGRPTSLWLRWDEMPIILDGGCSVVTFTYDLRTQHFKNVACNGVS